MPNTSLPRAGRDSSGATFQVSDSHSGVICPAIQVGVICPGHSIFGVGDSHSMAIHPISNYQSGVVYPFSDLSWIQIPGQ